jgi:hypothetical protein
VPQEISQELQRVVRRWQQLPVDHALGCMPRVRRLVDDLAESDVPDLGPAVVMDQLTVVVYDACESGGQDDLTARLAELRRGLS